MKRLSFAGLLGAIALAVCLPSHAQYAWIDENGTKQFSDMPPPASVPANRILKRPRSAGNVEPVNSAIDNPPPASTQEKNAEFRKRQLERAEKEKKATEEARQAADKAEYCNRAREYNRALDSGIRMGQIDQNGERSYLTDEQRAQEQQKTKRMLEDCR